MNTPMDMVRSYFESSGRRVGIRGLAALLCLLALPARFLCASSGTEGASFLDIPVGAGPAALGSAYTPLATNAYAPVWNPAGLGMLSGIEVAVQRLSNFKPIHYEFLSFV